jgi:hypothetical protein
MAAHLDQSNYQANQKHMLGLAVPEHPMPKKKILNWSHVVELNRHVLTFLPSKLAVLHVCTGGVLRASPAVLSVLSK